MAQERTLGIANAKERVTDEPSKVELQRRMEEARESISETVTEIKETVAQQVENVKDALDWREHFKRQPVAWSLGALGVGFLAGYGLAAAIKGDSEYEEEEYYTAPSYGRASLGEYQYAESAPAVSPTNGETQDGPGLLTRFKETSAYEKLSREAGSLGDRLLEELSTTAHTVVLPLFLNKVKHWIGLDLSEKPGEQRIAGSTQASSERQRSGESSYQPVLERPA